MDASKADEPRPFSALEGTWPLDEWPLDVQRVDENGIDTSIGTIQSQAWLVSTAAGRWWVWEFVSVPADGRALMHDSHSYGP